MPHKRAKRSVREAETAKKGYNLAPTSSSKDDTPRSASRILNSWAVQSAFRASGRKSSEDTGQGRKGKRRKNKEKDVNQPNGSNASPRDKGKGRARPDENVQVHDSRTSKKGQGKGKSDGGQAKKNGEGSGSGSGAGTSTSHGLRIMPHETLGEYNRRVENTLRGDVSKAIKDANALRAAQEKSAKSAAKEKCKAGVDSNEDDIPDEKLGDDEDRLGIHEEQGVRGGKKRKREFDAPSQRRRLNDIAQAPPTLLHLKKAPQRAGSVWGAKGQGKSGLSVGQERILAEERERVVKRYREMKAEREAKRDNIKL